MSSLGANRGRCRICPSVAARLHCWNMSWRISGSTVTILDRRYAHPLPFEPARWRSVP